MKPLSINLSKKQSEYYAAIKWLTNPMGPRGSGRTHLMAVTFIEHSLYFKMAIPIYNHGDNAYTKQEMLKRISDIVGDQKDLCLEIKNINSSTPTIHVKRK